MEAILVVTIFALYLGLSKYGGQCVVQHYSLRFTLALGRSLPIQLITFLEMMKGNILLQRAGAHYRFIHRSLQEHIGVLTDEEIEALSSPHLN